MVLHCKKEQFKRPREELFNSIFLIALWVMPPLGIASKVSYFCKSKEVHILFFKISGSSSVILPGKLNLKDELPTRAFLMNLTRYRDF